MSINFKRVPLRRALLYCFTLSSVVFLGVLFFIADPTSLYQVISVEEQDPVGTHILDQYILDPLEPLYVDLKKLDEYGIEDLKTRRRIHNSNYEFSAYRDFLKLYKNKKDKIHKAPLEEKCVAFFNHWSEKHPDWMFRTFQNIGERYDKSIVDKKFCYERSRKLILENKHNQEISKEDNRTIEEMFQKGVRESTKVHADMADTVSILRLYGKCFLGTHSTEPKHERSEKESKLFNTYTDKLFPFFNMDILPEFFSAELEDSIPKNSIPQFDAHDKYLGHVLFNPEEINLIDFMHQNNNGRGIVISAASHHTEDMVKLIRLLRALNNKLPIQILYDNGFDKELKERVQHVATQSVEELFDSKWADDFDSISPEISLFEKSKEYGSEFPKQLLWFVNVHGTIHKAFTDSFVSYSNKNLALIFSSFREIILMDADTIPAIPIEEFFDRKEYRETGTLYFQDRSLRQTNQWIETNYYAQLFPNNENSLDTLFDIPRVTKKTLGNKYMSGWKHHMESGVVVFDKSRHFLGMMMTISLCLWREPALTSVWGDKETYWMGLSMAGDENYHMNELGAASLGETTNPAYKVFKDSEVPEICGTHPGHVYKETGQLLWFNAGFKFCKRNSYEEDTDKFPYSIFNVTDVQQLYETALQVHAAVVPPDMPYYRPMNSPPETVPAEKAFAHSWGGRKKDMDELPDMNDGTDRRIKDYGPQKGWVTSRVCNGNFYCAYPEVVSYDDTSKTDRGYYVEFSEYHKKFYAYLGKIWMTGQKVHVPDPAPVVEPISEK